jgi:DNA primase
MSVVDDVKSKIDIVDVIGQYVTLKKAGRNFKALCPFHNEKTPSFVVYPDEGRWYCFGACHTGGDAFTFLMKKENIDFGEALRRLAQRAGVQLHRETPGEDAARNTLREILATAAAYYHQLLKNHPAAQQARDYLAKRFVTPETAARFELGYALDEWEALRAFLVGKGYSARDLEAAGLVIAREGGSGYYDRFRGRLMFPIRDRTGHVIGFGARTLTNTEPKYLNSPQTLLFDKSATLYGLDLAKDAIRQSNLAVIVEGYMDVIGAHQAGFCNVVASLGTALTEKQLDLLKRLTTRYAFALDPDVAGQEATLRGLQIAREALARKTVAVPRASGRIAFEERLDAELFVIGLPNGKDPDELIHDDPQQWVALTAQPEPLVDFYFRLLTRDLDLRNAHDKSVAVQRLAPVIREIGDAVQRAHYTQKLARLVQVAEPTIVQEVARVPRPRAPAREEPVMPSAPPRAIAAREEFFLTLALRTPEHLPRVAFLDADDFADGELRAFYLALRQFAESNEWFERAAFEAALPDALRATADRLRAAAQALPDLSEPDLAREIELAAYRLRAERDKNELARLELLLREQDELRDATEEQHLRARVAFLLKRVAENQKALGARTLLSAPIL